MLKNRIKIVIFMVMAGAMTLNACKKEEDKTINVKPDNRVFIVNEGPFMTGSGSLDVYYRDTEELVNDAFKKVNGFELGNLVQSVAVHNNKVYIVVNNANRIEVASKEELVFFGTIENINLPR
ncbi:MAG TPA: DUF5074 domain-containing protein, partial [Bacteroidales bacterium]|nr:DUF5074 domain-containing protein [Bacteroidales bacterium]